MTAIPYALTNTPLRRFHLDRSEDLTGVSGTGTVAAGVIFHDGTVAMRWMTGVSSVAVYDSIDDVVTIHGHNGATVVNILDEAHA